MTAPLTRRTLLRGLGVSLGLPLLEAMTPRRLLGKAPTAAPPLRLAYIFVPGGVNVDAWTPDGEGADYQPRFTLEAIKPVRDKVLILSGLDGRHGETGANGHPLGCAPWLSGRAFWEVSPVASASDLRYPCIRRCGSPRSSSRPGRQRARRSA